MNRHIAIGMIICAIAQVIIFVQINAQFIWPATKNHKFLVAALSGTVISYLLMHGVSEIVKGFGGQIWPGRLVPGVTGTIVFAFMTWIMFKQGIDFKTGICIILSIVILIIQVYWK